MLLKPLIYIAIIFSVILPQVVRAQDDIHTVPGNINTLDYLVRSELFVSGLEVPWGLAFIDKDTALVTERSGRLRLINKGELSEKPVKGTPEVWAKDHPWNQGGLLDITIDPDYKSNGWIYLAYSHALAGSEKKEDRFAMTKVVRGKIQDHTWVSEETIFEVPSNHYSETVWHYGGRLVFDNEGHLYIPVGDRGEMQAAQSLTNPKGKLHRILPDGSIPKDNPHQNANPVSKTIFSHGHRNPQGLSINPVTGDVWEAEHGPRGGDEINIPRKGKNYGWPDISYGIDYDGSIITPHRQRDGKEQPVYFWRPSIGLSAIAFYTGDQFPLWKNHLLAAGLASRDVRLLTIANDKVMHEEVIFRAEGRPYSIEVGPDGAIYIVMSDPGQIVRLTAIKEDRQ